MIAYDSIPVYNYSYLSHGVNPSDTGLAVFTDKLRGLPVWTCADWVAFFNALKRKYGESKAKDIWTYYWNLGLSKGSGGAGDVRAGSGLWADSVPLDCRTFDSDFRAFLAKYKLYDVVYKGLGAIARPLGASLEIVENVGSAVSSTAKIIKYGVPALLLVGCGLLIWYGVRKVKLNS